MFNQREKKFWLILLRVKISIVERACDEYANMQNIKIVIMVASRTIKIIHSVVYDGGGVTLHTQNLKIGSLFSFTYKKYKDKDDIIGWSKTGRNYI